MSVFTYKAFNREGGVETGEIEARNRPDAIAQIERLKLQPVNVRDAGKPASREAGSAGQSRAERAEADTPRGPVRLSRQQVILFTEELSDLLDAGLQLESALRIIEERQERSPVKTLAGMLRQRVRDGEGFSNALRQCSPSFGELYCSLCAAGELSGALPSILKRQVSYLTIIADLRSQIVQALIYPAFIVGAGLLLMILFMAVLVPQLISLFEKTDRELPVLTQLLIGTSNFVSAYWWLILLVVVGGWVGFLAYVRQPGGRLWWDHAKLNLPLFGPVFACGFLAQFCQTLSNLVGNGLPLLTGLHLMEKSAGNTFYAAKIERIANIVADGGAFSRAMKRVGGFPEVFIDLVSVGEQTGDLASSLEKAAARYEKEMNRRISRITALIQPVVITGIAVLVGAVVYSIVTSIFEAVSSMRPGG